MRKIATLIVLVFLLLLAMTGWLVSRQPQAVSADVFLTEDLPRLQEALLPLSKVDLTPITGRLKSSELSDLEMLIPHYQDYPLQELQNLFEYAKNCSRVKNSKAGAPELRKAWAWLEYTCKAKVLKKDFFKKPPYVFPSGRSFVQLAQDLNFEFKNYLVISEIDSYKTILEGLLKTEVGHELSLQQVHGLLRGEDFLIGQDFVFMKQKNTSDLSPSRIYLKVSKAAWNELLQDQNFKLEEELSARCVVRYSNGCWVLNEKKSLQNRKSYLSIIFALDVLLLLALLAFVFVDRRRKAKARAQQRFALQMLTHELRTPATTLSLILEDVRRDFDSFRPRQQINFLKMASEISRLKNSMQMSYAYLQTDSNSPAGMKIDFQKIEVESFLLELLAQEEFQPIFFRKTGESLSIEAESFWLTLALENLFRNALTHGQPPVEVSLSISETQIGITVKDEGQIEQSNLKSLTQAFEKGPRSRGLGLGLAIIGQIVSSMNGHLEIQRSPTRFTLYLRRRR